jgi:hypothetical protein
MQRGGIGSPKAGDTGFLTRCTEDNMSKITKPAPEQVAAQEQAEDSGTTMRVVSCHLECEVIVEQCVRYEQLVVRPLSAPEEAEAMCHKCFRDFMKSVAKMKGVTVHKPDALREGRIVGL